MHSPKAPTEDPAVAAAQASEQARAEAGQISQTQIGLNADTIALRRRFGSMAATLGNGSGIAGFGVPGSTGAPGVGAGTGGGGGGLFSGVGGSPLVAAIA